jgi:type VI secretion system protein ImpA
MAVIDIENLLQEVSPDSPSGEDLEYDPAFRELEKAAQPKPAPEFAPDQSPEPPDWHEVQTKAMELLVRSKDLRPALYLVKALLHNQGFSGLRDGLRLLNGLLEKYWETLYPRLDPEDDYDPTLRVNLITSLCDREFMLQAVRRTALVSAPLLGSFSLRDIDIATGVLKLPPDTAEAAADPAIIDAAFTNCELEPLQATAYAVRESIDTVVAIEDTVTAWVGTDKAPNLNELVQVLRQIQNALNERLAQRGVSQSAAPGLTTVATELSAVAALPSTATPLSGEITCRDDVIRWLDKLCEYYKRSEPSSPVPILLQRAKRLVSKDFMEIVRDLAPESVAQFEYIRGAESENTS